MLNRRLEARLQALRERHDLSEEAVAALRAWVGELTGQETLLTWSTEDPSGDPEAPRAAAPAPQEPAPELPRPESLLGTGGTAEVWRAWDPALERQVALKVLRPALSGAPGPVARFWQEARATARMQHPGVVPVHAVGHLPDGRPFFTMEEIRGRPLAALLADHHRGDRHPVSLRRLVEHLLRAAEALAWAHDQGILHRDFKPDNVMIGEYGEVRVIDWGLLQEPGGDRARGGTPAYTAPEQARGEPLGPPADVYALGASLFHALSGGPPHPGVGLLERAGRPEPPPPPGPEALVEICQRAMDPDPGARFADAAAFAEALRAWLEGARARSRALKIVEEAGALRPEIARHREAAAALRAEAEALAERTAAAAPIEAKRPLWALEDRAAAEERAARQAEVTWLQRLRAALDQAPDLPEARARLADHYQAAQARAEAAGEREAAAEAESWLRTYDDGRHAGWLEGEGLLTLRVSPPGARVTLAPFIERDRRLVPGPARDLGPAPLVELPLAAGSYLLTLSAPGRAPARYPVLLQRQRRWEGELPLLLEGALGPEDVYVPAGWYLSGGRERVQKDVLPPRRIWLEGFILRRYPVTNREYLAFLNDLLERGQEDRALALQPREHTDTSAPGEAFYGRDSGGRFVLVPDADGDLWDPAWPALHVNFEGASAYAAWLATRTGLPWTLPREYQWEKAARGVDGRPFPWGHHFDPTFCSMRHSRPGGALPARVGDFPADESPYGVRGMAGNAVDWCLDPYRPGGPPLDARGRPLPLAAAPGEALVGRGGAWSYNDRACRTDYRLFMKPGFRRSVQSFRLCRPLVAADTAGG
jgi:formylglycine-generating enzyme required for sulfatase activity